MEEASSIPMKIAGSRIEMNLIPLQTFHSIFAPTYFVLND